MTILRYVPRDLPRPFTVRDLENHFNQHIEPRYGVNASRLAQTTLHHWIRNGTVKTSRQRCPIFNIPQYVRSRQW